MSLAQKTREARRTPREAVDYQSQIWGIALAATPAQVVNLSPHGCMLRCDATVPIGETLIVDMPGLASQRGLVIWALGARIGLEFDHAIALEEYLDMLAKMKGPSNGPLFD